MAKNIKKASKEEPKVKTKTYPLKKDFQTDKGLLRGGKDSITVGEKGAEFLKSQKII